MAKTRLIGLIALVMAGVILGFSTYTVLENELVIVTRFGNPKRIITTSGLHPKLPGFFESVNRFDKRADLFETQPTQLLLGDKKPIIINCFILWQIDDPLLFFQSMGQTEIAVERIGDIVNSKLSIVLSDYATQDLLNIDTEKMVLAKIEDRVTVSANENTVAKYGIKILKTGVQRLAYPAVVINAVFERMESERVKEADKIRAEGSEVARKIKIEAEKKAREIRAEADKQALILKGEGDYESMTIYTKAYQQGSEFFDFIKSLETYENVLGEDTTLIISTDSDLFKHLRIHQPGAKDHE